MNHLLKTPLYSVYDEYGAKIVDFAGWALPLQFEGIIPEHHAVRESAGLFDVSHMGEIDIRGEDALFLLNKIMTNDVARLKDNQIQYSVMVNDAGGTIDDVLVYRFDENHYWVIVNAANRQKDAEWIMSMAADYKADIADISDNVAQLALQGPKAVDIMRRAAGEAVDQIRFFRFAKSLKVNGVDCLVSRSGYTGEDGFELYVKPQDAPGLWRSLLETGRELGLKPAGLGCRDTLRFEACLPLYGHELSEDITPLEAGLDWVVKLDKPDFIGKAALEKQLKEGVPRRLAGFEMLERGIPRGDYEVKWQGRTAGFVTTGYMSPTLGRNIGLALLDADAAKLGEQIEIVIRGKAVKAVIVETPFYSKKYKK